jgi:hypothetical protein
MARGITKQDVVVDPVAAWDQEPDGVYIPGTPRVARHDETSGPVPAGQPAGQEPAAGPEPRFCTLCGNEAGPASRFCAHCGTSLDSPAPVSQSFAIAEASRVTSGPPKPEGLLTAEERAERERQHLEAIRLGAMNPPVQYVPPTGQRPTVVIHFLSNGFSFAGVVWMRGQEIELEEGTPRWAEAQAWINKNDFEQIDAYGRIIFRHGPWPGRRYSDARTEDFQPVTVGSGEKAQQYRGPSPAELAAADEAERRRRRGVPAAL